MPPASFDHTTARAGTAACGRALAVLDDATTRVEAARIAAVQDWVGPHRRAYDEAAATLRGAADDARAALVALHRVLADAEERERSDRLARGAC